MNVQNIEKKENNTASFQAIVEAADFEKAVNEVYKRNKKDLYIPGFRKGKAPRAVIEGMYGKQIFFEEAVEDLADPTFQAALAETGCDIENIGLRAGRAHQKRRAVVHRHTVHGREAHAHAGQARHCIFGVMSYL